MTFSNNAFHVMSDFKHFEFPIIHNAYFALVIATFNLELSFKNPILSILLLLFSPRHTRCYSVKLRLHIDSIFLLKLLLSSPLALLLRIIWHPSVFPSGKSFLSCSPDGRVTRNDFQFARPVKSRASILLCALLLFYLRLRTFDMCGLSTLLELKAAHNGHQPDQRQEYTVIIVLLFII